MHLHFSGPGPVADRPSFFFFGAVRIGDHPSHRNRPAAPPFHHHMLLGVGIPLRIGYVLHRRFGGGVASRQPAPHLPSPVVAEEFDRDGSVGVLGADQHRRLRVVAENQIRVPPADGGLVALRVAAEIVAVRVVLDVLQPGVEHRVVESGGELAHPSPHRVLQFAPDNGGGGLEAPLCGAFPHRIVQGQGVAGHHYGAVDYVGEQVDVGHPRLAAGMPGGELGDFLLDSQGQDVLGGHFRRRSVQDGHLGGPVRSLRRFGGGDRRRLRVQQGAGESGIYHHVVVPVGGDGGVDRRVLEFAAQSFQRNHEQRRVEPHRHPGGGLPLHPAVEGAYQQILLQRYPPGRIVRIFRLFRPRPVVRFRVARARFGGGGVRAAQDEGHRSGQQGFGFVHRPGYGRDGEQGGPVDDVQNDRTGAGKGEQGFGQGGDGGVPVDFFPRTGVFGYRGGSFQPDGTFERNIQHFAFIVGQQAVYRPFVDGGRRFQLRRPTRLSVRHRLQAEAEGRRVGAVRRLLRQSRFVQVEADIRRVQGEFGPGHPHRHRLGGYGVLQRQQRPVYPVLVRIGGPGRLGADRDRPRRRVGAGTQVAGDPIHRARDYGHPDQRHRGVKNVAAGFCFASVLCHFRNVRGIADG